MLIIKDKIKHLKERITALVGILTTDYVLEGTTIVPVGNRTSLS